MGDRPGNEAMTDERIDAFAAEMISKFEHFARGCGFDAIQARMKLDKIRSMSLDERRAAARATIAAQAEDRTP